MEGSKFLDPEVSTASRDSIRGIQLDNLKKTDSQKDRKDKKLTEATAIEKHNNRSLSLEIDRCSLGGTHKRHCDVLTSQRQ